MLLRDIAKSVDTLFTISLICMEEENIADYAPYIF